MALALPRQSAQSGERPFSSLSMHNIVVAGRRTSVRLEASMWDGLQDIARRRGMNVNHLVTEIEQNRSTPGLTAAIRVYIVDFYRRALGMIDSAETATPRV